MDQSGNEGNRNPTKAKGRDKGRGRTIGFVILALGIAACGAGAALYGGGFGEKGESTDNAAVGGLQVVISAQSLEKIVSLTAAEGDRVAKGQILVRMDESALQARKSKALASAAYAAKNSELAKVKLDEAKDDFDRGTLQMENKVVSREQYEHLRQAYQAAKAGLDIALAQEEVAGAELRGVETDLGKAELASPVDGIVARVWAAEGETVQPAQAIYTICDLGRLWVEANFKETQIAAMRPGDPASFTVDAVPGRSFQGKVASVGAAAASAFALIPQDTSAGNFTKITQRVPVRISIDEPAGGGSLEELGLKPGLSVEVRVRTGREPRP